MASVSPLRNLHQVPVVHDRNVSGWSTPKNRGGTSDDEGRDSPMNIAPQPLSGSNSSAYRRRSTFDSAFQADPLDSKHDTDPLQFVERGAFAFFKNLFRLRGTVLSDIWPQLLSVMLLAAVVCVFEDLGPFSVAMPHTGHSTMGSLLSLLLVFRNNISHQRYNEARLLLSQVKNGMRTIALMVHTTAYGLNPDAPADRRQQFLSDAKELTKQLQLLFSAMVDDVRDTREELPTNRKDRPAPLHNMPPVKVSFRRMTQRIIESRRTNNPELLYRRYSPHLRPVIVAGQVQRQIHEMAQKEYGPCTLPEHTAKYSSRLLHEQVMRAWEHMVRIVTTPAPFLYRHMLNMLTFMFVFSLPFSLVEEFGYATIPMVGILGAGFYGVQSLAHELENPLGWDVNDIDLDGFQSLLTEEMVTIHAHTFGLTPQQASEHLPRNLPAKANAFANSVLDVLSAKKKAAGTGAGGVGGAALSRPGRTVGGLGLRVGGGVMLPLSPTKGSPSPIAESKASNGAVTPPLPSTGGAVGSGGVGLHADSSSSGAGGGGGTGAGAAAGAGVPASATRGAAAGTAPVSSPPCGRSTDSNMVLTSLPDSPWPSRDPSPGARGRGPTTPSPSDEALDKGLLSL